MNDFGPQECECCCRIFDNYDWDSWRCPYCHYDNVPISAPLTSRGYALRRMRDDRKKRRKEEANERISNHFRSLKIFRGIRFDAPALG